MTGQIELKFTPGSSFLLAGVTVNPAYNAVTAQDEDKLPYITATALKGAMRMEFEAFVNGIELKNACDLNAEETGHHRDNPCLACRIFGGSNYEGKLRFNALHLEEGTRQSLKEIIHDIFEKGIRTGVSISRNIGISKDQHLFTAMTFPYMQGQRDLVFKGVIDIEKELEDDEKQYLDAFFSFIGHTGIWVGARKSSGLGHFLVSGKIIESDQAKPTLDMTNRELKLFRLTLQTREPLVLGGIKNRFILNTLPYLPASTIGGCLAFALIKKGVPGTEIDSMYNHRKTFSPFNFYIDNHLPIPQSTRAPKGAQKETEYRDILLPDFLVQHALQLNRFQTVEKIFEKIYRSNLRPVPICKQPATSYNAKLAMDRNLNRGKEGKLYSLEMIPKGVNFQGLIIAEAWLEETLKSITSIIMGGKRSKGFGRVAIKKVETLTADSLLNKEINLDASLREQCRPPELELGNRLFFSLDLLNDLSVPGNGDYENFKNYIEQGLFPDLDFKIEKAYPEVVLRGGYDFRENRPKPLKEKIGAGSTFLVSVPKDKEGLFREKAAGMIAESHRFHWEETPLFVVNHPNHLNNWR